MTSKFVDFQNKTCCMPCGCAKPGPGGVLIGTHVKGGKESQAMCTQPNAADGLTRAPQATIGARAVCTPAADANGNALRDA